MKFSFAIFVLASAARLFAQEDLHGQDFEGKSLKGRNLKNADLRETNFTDADLTGADLTGAKLDRTDLRGADLSKANLQGLDLSKALTRDTCFRAADLRGTRGLADMTELDFTDADLRGADLSAAKDFHEGSARFKGARYDASTKWPRGVDPKTAGAKLEGPAVPKDPPPVPKDPPPAPKDPPKVPPPAKPEPGKGRDLRKKDFSRRDLRGEDLQGANLEGAMLWSVDLRGSNLSYVSLKGADLTSARLDGADLTGADLRDAVLKEVNLNGAKLVDARLEGVNLTEARDITDASFRGADLRGLKGLPQFGVGGNDWRDADLRGADLANTNIASFKNARFRRAKYDRATAWPTGMDLESSGAELVEELADAADLVPPKLFAPDHDWNAPSEERVKKLFKQMHIIKHYGPDLQKLGKKPFEEPTGNHTAFRFSGLEYARSKPGVVLPKDLTPEKLKALDPATLPHRTIFPIRVRCETIWTDANGGRVKADHFGEIAFFLNDDEEWECRVIEEVILLR